MILRLMIDAINIFCFLNFSTAGSGKLTSVTIILIINGQDCMNICLLEFGNREFQRNSFFIVYNHNYHERKTSKL